MQIYSTDKISKKMDYRIILKFVKFCVDKLGIDEADCIMSFDSRRVPRDSNGVTTFFRDKSCVIAISSNLTPKTTLTTIAHELTHVKQFQSGRMIFENDKPRFDGSSDFSLAEFEANKQAENLRLQFAQNSAILSLYSKKTKTKN